MNLFMSQPVGAGDFSKDFRIQHLVYYHQLLIERSVIYQNLAPKERIAFEKRLLKFMKSHNFIYAGSGKEAETGLKVLISAAAVQICYGHPHVYLRYFKDIIIYEEEYQSLMTGKYNEGEVNTLGAIVLSKKYIELGFADPNDGRNLLMHELAHALMLDNLFGPTSSGFFDPDNVFHFQQLALNEIDMMNSGGRSFFRDYGATNFQEFFAVSVECYFEQTTQFMNYHPELFDTLKKLLNIDLNLIVRTNH